MPTIYKKKKYISLWYEEEKNTKWTLLFSHLFRIIVNFI